VKRIGEDFRHPHQTRTDVPDEKQLQGAKQQGAKADDQPDLADMLDESAAIGMRGINPKQRRA
jgi:hypothetical protein